MDLNPFRLCSGLKFLGYFMILLVFALIALSYYAVVLTLAPHLLDGAFKSFFYFLLLALFSSPGNYSSDDLRLIGVVVLILFASLVFGILHFEDYASLLTDWSWIKLVLLAWSYFMVVFRDPGAVPPNWKVIPEQDIEKEDLISSNSLVPDNNSARPSSYEGLERTPELRYCSHCQNGKPPRCHHCSVCQRCVLKMDHHCIWVVNCVGARNYKFFLLFVFYTFLETLMDALVLFPDFMNFFQQAKHHSSSPGKLAITFLAFVLNVAFALSLLCFVVMHTSLLLKNTTSVEVHEKKKTEQWKYDLGRRKNIEQVFGTRKVFWLFPVFTKQDLERVPALHGLDFPTCSDIINV